jgi:hypothetical protein
MKIFPVGAELSTDRQTDMTKLLLGFRNFANVSKNWETAQRLICHYDLFSQIVRLKKGHEQTKFLLFQCSIGHLTWRPTYVLLLLEISICHESIFEQHLTFLHGWQCHRAQQQALNALLLFLCNDGYTKAPQCYVKHRFLILFINFTTFHNFDVYYAKGNLPVCIVRKVI